jgi:hypothetical protein
MNSIITCLPKDVGLSDVASVLSSLGQVERQYEQQGSAHDLYVTRDSSHIWVDLDTENELPLEYDSEQIDFIQRTIGQFSGYIISYNDIELAKDAARSLAAAWPAVIDNDHGTMVSGADFIALMDSDPSWDWRRKATD